MRDVFKWIVIAFCVGFCMAFGHSVGTHLFPVAPTEIIVEKGDSFSQL